MVLLGTPKRNVVNQMSLKKNLHRIVRLEKRYPKRVNNLTWHKEMVNTYNRKTQQPSQVGQDLDIQKHYLDTSSKYELERIEICL